MIRINDFAPTVWGELEAVNAGKQLGNGDGDLILIVVDADAAVLETGWE